MDVVETGNIKDEVTDIDKLSTIKGSFDIETMQETLRCNILESMKGEKNVEEENIPSCIEEMIIKTEMEDETETELKPIKSENYKVGPGYEHMEHTVADHSILLDRLKLDHELHVYDMEAIKCERKSEKEVPFDGLQGDMKKQIPNQQDCSKYETGEVAIVCHNKTNIEQLQLHLPACKANDESTRQTHITVTHGKKVKYFKCRFCEYITNVKKSLKRHFTRKHSENGKLYQCVDCKYETKVKENLVQHCKFQHNEKIKWHQCLLCDYKTKYKYHLLKHLRLKHDDAPEVFHCKLCDFKTKYKKNLLLHNISKHDHAAEIFQCGLCDYKTKIKTILMRHQRFKHDDTAEIFACEVCEYKTKVKHTFLRHYRLKHDDTNEHFHCELCDYKTRRRSNLLLHNESKHTIQSRFSNVNGVNLKPK